MEKYRNKEALEKYFLISFGRNKEVQNEDISE